MSSEIPDITILRNRKIRGITRYHTTKKEIPIYAENKESPPIISFIRIIYLFKLLLIPILYVNFLSINSASEPIRSPEK